MEATNTLGVEMPSTTASCFDDIGEYIHTNLYLPE
jgi:hypothetical protein